MIRTDIAALQKWLDITPLHRHLDVRFEQVDAERGRVTLALPYHPVQTRRDGHDEVHGGAIATLIDVSAAAAIVVRNGFVGPTINLRIDYITMADGLGLTATAEIEAETRSSAVVDVKVTSRAGDIVALGRAVFSLKRIAQTGV